MHQYFFYSECSWLFFVFFSNVSFFGDANVMVA